VPPPRPTGPSTGKTPSPGVPTVSLLRWDRSSRRNAALLRSARQGRVERGQARLETTRGSVGVGLVDLLCDVSHAPAVRAQQADRSIAAPGSWGRRRRHPNLTRRRRADRRGFQTCSTPASREPLARSSRPARVGRLFPCCTRTAPAVETQQPNAALLRSARQERVERGQARLETTRGSVGLRLVDRLCDASHAPAVKAQQADGSNAAPGTLGAAGRVRRDRQVRSGLRWHRPAGRSSGTRAGLRWHRPAGRAGPRGADRRGEQGRVGLEQTRGAPTSGSGRSAMASTDRGPQRPAGLFDRGVAVRGRAGGGRRPRRTG
jgi:hypothetical protein